ncbi:MAG: isoprenylcysteine carboxylmethyltransferase family protein [Candidatus Thermoplasmatota archaeon]
MPSTKRIVAALVAIVAAIIVGVTQFDQIVASITVYLGGASLEGIMGVPLPRNYWSLVLLNILLVSSFLFLVPVRVQGSWKAHGAYLGFMVSMFSEMFGFPLTVYFLSGAGYAYFEPQFVGYVWAYGQLVGSPVVVAGLWLLYKGWKEVYYVRDDALVNSGVYRVIRHPQYLGLLLITLGQFLVWPTIPTAILWPILVGLYYRQARKEEAVLSEKFGAAFREYASKTPMLLPRINFRRVFKAASP